MPAQQWYTLVRFKDTPEHLTGVSETRTAADAVRLVGTWEESFPADTVVVFDPQRKPMSQRALHDAAALPVPIADALSGSPRAAGVPGRRVQH